MKLLVEQESDLEFLLGTTTADDNSDATSNTTEI